MESCGRNLFSLVAIVVYALSCLGACDKVKFRSPIAPADPLVGTWTSADNAQQGIEFHADGTVTFVFPPGNAEHSSPETMDYFRNSTTTYTKGETTIVYRTDVRRTIEYKNRTPQYIAQDGFKMDSSTYKLDGDALTLGGQLLYRRR